MNENIAISASRRLVTALALSVPERVASHCPDDEQIAVFVDASTRQAGYEDFIQHLGGCERCYQIWRDARAASLNLSLPGDMLELNTPSKKVLTALVTQVAKPEADCLDDNLIAAYVDHALAEGERQHVMAHLADCEKCYETWISVASAQVGHVGERRQVPDSREAVPLDVPAGRDRIAVVPQGMVGDLSRWLNSTFGGKRGAFGGGLATAAVLVLAILVALPQKRGARDDLLALYGDVAPFGESALLGLESAPEVIFNRSVGVPADSELAFQAGIRAGFGRIIPNPNAQWSKSLKSMEIALPQCMVDGTLESCSEPVRAGFEAGEWMAIAYTGCTAGKAESMAPQLAASLKRITSSLGTEQSKGGFADAMRSVDREPVDAVQICKLVKNWVG